MRGELRTFCLLLALSTSACSAPETAMTSDKSSPGSDPSTAELEAKYKRNPAPKQGYQITLKLADAPGPFGSVKGFVNFEAPDCKYTPDPIAGVSMTPLHGFEMELQRVDDTTYTGTVHTDAMLDEDYLGEGVCHWQLTSLNAQLKATGAEPETNFIVSLMNEDVTAQRAVTKYYWKERYPRSQVTDYPDMGKEDRDVFRSEIRDELFTMTLLSKAMTP